MNIDPTNITHKIDKFLADCSGADIKLYSQMTLDKVKFKHVNRYPVIILNHQQVIL